MGRAAEFGAGHPHVPARIGMEGFILRCERGRVAEQPEDGDGSHRIAGTSSPSRSTVNGTVRALGPRPGSEVTLQYPVSPALTRRR